MNIIAPGENLSSSTDGKEEIITSTNESLGKSLNLGNLLNEFEELNPEIVEIKDLRDNKDYIAKDILPEMIRIAEKSGYSDVRVLDKKIDNNNRLVSFGLEAKSEKYGGCFVRLNFVRNCSYGNVSGSDETCIIEEYYDDDTFAYPFDAEVVYNY